MMWRKLLVSHDFSPCSDQAVSVAAELARVHASELVLLHVSKLPENLRRDTVITPTSGAESVRVDEYTGRGARQRLESIAEPLRRARLTVTTLADTGDDVALRIIAIATELGADALVVGTHGRMGLEHLVLGSVAEHVIRNAPVPVVCVRAPTREALLTREESDLQDELEG